jgi:predicted transcriptional regulator of viral defense system
LLYTGVNQYEIVTDLDTNMDKLTRTIPPTSAKILEHLELNQPKLVSTADLESLRNEVGIKTPARVIAARLRDKGWLLPTSSRGVWEFVPAAVAGPYSENDPLTPLKAALLKNPNTKCGLTFQTAAWLYGFADRVPSKLEVAVINRNTPVGFNQKMQVSVYIPRLAYNAIREVPVLAIESIFVQLAHRPSVIKSWSGVLEWLPEVAADISEDKLLYELKDRPLATIARTGYLFQGMRLDLADTIYNNYPIVNKTWFGPRGTLKNHDNHWLVADTILPFDPKKLEDVR